MRDISSQEPYNDIKYNTLFDELYVPLCRYCMKLVGDSTSAEDIVQEQFIYIWEKWDRLKDIAAINSYLYKAVKNRSINYLIKKSQQITIDELINPIDRTEESNLVNPEQLLESKDLEKILEQALASLPNKCRNIFILKRFGELSNKEIADKLSISIKTVEAQMTIALRRLKISISENWHTILLPFTSALYTLF